MYICIVIEFDVIVIIFDDGVITFDDTIFLIIRYPVIRKHGKPGPAVNFAGSGVALFYKKGNAPPQGQKVLAENRSHLCPDAEAPAVGTHIHTAYLIPGKGFGAGVDLPHYLAVKFCHKDILC